MMRFIFWQNVISIHQSAFIKALSAECDVTLVVEDTLDQQRRNEKWQVPSMGDAKVVIAPNDAEIAEMLSQNDTHHVFSGIDAFPLVYKVFKLAVKRGVPISVLAEPYEWMGVKGFLRRVKYSMLFMRYGKHINHLFTTGNMGMLCYRKAGFPYSKLHQWGYFTEQTGMPMVNSDLPKQLAGVKLLYVGRIDTNKNILPILRDFNLYSEHIDCFSIIGDGPLYSELQTLALNNPKIKVLGRLCNDDAQKLMCEHDYLVLPSLYDGWGAVVNEALGVGIRVLCSEACGASILLDGKMRGTTFNQENACMTIKEWSAKGKLTVNERDKIKTWAKEHISGVVAANYFRKTIEGKACVAPWLQ